jgi:hypothetical protein
MRFEMKIFGHHIYLPLALLGLIEVIAVLLACWLESEFSQYYFGHRQFIWDRSVLFAACIFTSMMAMGLYNKRVQDGLARRIRWIGLTKAAC